MKRRVVVCVAACSVAAFVATAAAGSADAQKSYENGKALLAKADFKGALEAFAAAARADTANREYREQYALLRRVIQMREMLAREKNAAKWEATARGLRGYYHANRIYDEALALDREVHARLNTPDSAKRLAETQLALGLNADAEKLLAGLNGKATPQTNVLLGIALARQKKVDQAKALAAKIEVPADATSGFFYDLACLRALLGDSAGAATMLSRSLELTPPSMVESVRKHAREDKDLASLAGSEELAKALKTESKVKESACSGGSNCGQCPSKASCSTAGGGASHPEEKK